VIHANKVYPYKYLITDSFVATCRGSDGQEYQVGDTFPAGDGCNTWYVVLAK